jgi:hypothetical protein
MELAVANLSPAAKVDAHGRDETENALTKREACYDRNSIFSATDPDP